MAPRAPSVSTAAQFTAPQPVAWPHWWGYSASKPAVAGAGHHQQQIGSEKMKRGDRGADVRQLQQLLKQAGLFLKVDGDYGENAEKALLHYQTQYNLVPDGCTGDKPKHYSGVIAWYLDANNQQKSVTADAGPNYKHHFSHLYTSENNAKRAAQREWGKVGMK